MTMPTRFKLIAATLAVAALATACGGGGDDPALAGDSSGDAVARYIGTWESDCYSDSGASAKVRADFTKTSPTSFTGNVIAYGYIGTSCSGPSVKDKKILTNMSMNHDGTKEIAGVTADKFAGASDQGNGKVVLYAAGDVLQIGDPDAAKDAEGYPEAFLESKYTVKRKQ
ncbi:hypothetical protein [Hydrogenophaga sp. MI9]|uniref:hypothetical protein n=1 Tax=Hydrogenophaga sp. MI9 TaxID=3453719 RepID=UPI003EEAAF59